MEGPMDCANSNKNIFSAAPDDKIIENSEIKCPRCGHTGRFGAVYCEKCGARLSMIPRENRDREITRELPRINLS